MFYFFYVFCFVILISCSEDPVGQEPDTHEKPDEKPKVDPFEKVKVVPKEFDFSSDYWWPEQKVPKKVITCQVASDNYPERMLAESLAGIAAKAVNEGKNDELIWISVSTPAIDEWYKRTLGRLGISANQSMDVWNLLKYLAGKGLVKGYVVYDYDNGAGAMYTNRSDMDISANIATSIVGVTSSALVDRKLEPKMLDAQLVKLFDTASGVTYKEVYNHLKPAINHNLIMMVDPKAPHHRDIAIAHNSMVFDGSSTSNMDYFFGRLRLSSPLLGWGFEDEYVFTSRASENGIINAASNWCWNLPLLSAGARSYQTKKLKSLHPKNIDWTKQGHFHSFVMSDGDNLQWAEFNFTHHSDYWANANNGLFPFGWTTCSGQMSETLPTTLDYLAETQPGNISFIEFGSGYHYPDLMGKRTNVDLAIRTHAKKVNLHMQKNGVKVFGFICSNMDSPDAKNAYQTYAEELENLTGMIALQYAPYEAGNGKIYWVTDSKGRHIPVVTAKYSLWANLNNERAGSPEKIANLINQDAQNATSSGTISNYWTVVHAWSQFVKNGAEARGLTPVKWTVDLLNKDINVINTEEMLWRIRMKYYPDEVQQIINSQ